jgi:hypothetical protein
MAKDRDMVPCREGNSVSVIDGHSILLLPDASELPAEVFSRGLGLWPAPNRILSYREITVWQTRRHRFIGPTSGTLAFIKTQPWPSVRHQAG